MYFKAILPPGWSIKRVAPDKVVVMQEMKDETSTYVADTRDGVVDAVLYRLASALADVPVVDPLRDGLTAALSDAFVALGKAGGNVENGPFRAEWLAAREALKSCGVTNI